MPENWIEKVNRWIGLATELALLLVALAIVLSILVGSDILFFQGVVTRLIALIRELGDNGLVGLIAIAIILWLFSKRKLV